MGNEKIYYLETNAIYALVNNLNLITEKFQAYTSLYALNEIVSGTYRGNFLRRKSVLKKLFESNMKIVPHMPKVMILAAFGKDISMVDKIYDDKVYLWEKAKIIIASESFEEYRNRVLKRFERDVLMEKDNEDEFDKELTRKITQIIHNDTITMNEKKKNEKEICKKYGVKNIFEISPDIKIEGIEYIEIDINRAFGFEDDVENNEGLYLERQLLVNILEAAFISYDENDITALIANRNKEKLCALFMGSLCYSFLWPYRGYIPKRNDILDICHLIYLQDENYVIVSNDKIFENISMASMRIKIEDLEVLCNQ